jgi:hypothetical protein
MNFPKKKWQLLLAATLFFQMYTSTPSALAASLPGPSSATQETLNKWHYFLEIYKSEKGRFPKTLEEVKGFRTKMPKEDCIFGKQFCQSAMSYEDGWKTPLKFESDGKKFRVSASHGFFLTDKSATKGERHLYWDNDGVIAVDPEPVRDYR